MLTIVIPTIRYTKYLDEAIESALKLKEKYHFVHIHININSKSLEFEKSQFWYDKNVYWRRVDHVYDKMFDSLNDAVKHAEGDRILILSDDDLVKENLLDGVSIETLSEFDLYANRVEYIDENGTLLNKEGFSYPQLNRTADDCLHDFFDGRITDHLSTFIYSRTLFEKVGGYKDPGFPNCFYVDSIFHAKIISLASSVYFSKDINFSRRESSFQASASFYLDSKSINKYFDVVVDEMISISKLKDFIIRRYHNIKLFKNDLIKRRFFIYLNKLNNNAIDEKPSKIRLLYSSLGWDTSLSFKIISPLIVIFWPLRYILNYRAVISIKRIFTR